MISLPALLVPLFGAIATGALTRFLGLFDAEDARRMSRFVFVVAMPFAGFEFMRRSEPPADIILGLGAAYLLSLALVSAAAFLIARRFLGLSVREAGAAVFSTTCGNAIFLGIPIALSVPSWAPPFLILVLFEGTVVFALGTALMTWPEEGSEVSGLGSSLGNLKDAVLRALQSPIVMGTLLGLGAALVDLSLPEPLAGFLGLMAGVAGPVGLFVLGLTATDLLLAGKMGHAREAALLLPVKLLLFPALTGAFAWAFTRDGTAATVAALFTGLPPAVASVVLASVYRQWVDGASAVVTAGTLLGLGTLTAFLVVAFPG